MNELVLELEADDRIRTIRRHVALLEASEEQLQLSLLRDPTSQAFHRMGLEAVLLGLAKEDTRVSAVCVHLPHLTNVASTYGARQGHSVVRATAEAVRVDGALSWTTRYADNTFVGIVFGDLSAFRRDALRDALQRINPLLVRDMGVGTVGLSPSASEDRLLDDLADAVRSIETPGGALAGATYPQMRLSDGEVEDAIVDSRLCLMAQETHDLVTLAATGETEVLVRLKRDGDILAPGSFLSVFGRCGMASRLDSWVVSAALRWLRSPSAPTSTCISVNVSSDTLADETFPDTLAALVVDGRVSPSSLALEISESALASDFAGTKRVMEALVARGFGIVLDDAGTTWLPASKVATLPLTAIKVYGGLVRDAVGGLATSANLRRLELIAALGTAADAKVVAKSIERFEWVGPILSTGISFGQGLALSATFPASG